MEGKWFTQHAYKRDRPAKQSAGDRQADDVAYFELGSFTLREIDASTWRVHVDTLPPTENPTQGDTVVATAEYVDVPAYLGKIIRNAIVAQHRVNNNSYQNHAVHNISEYHRPIVSNVMRDINCHRLVMCVLNMVRPSDLLDKNTLKDQGTWEDQYLNDLSHYHAVTINQQDSTPDLQKIQKVLEEPIDGLRREFPLLVE